MGRYDAGLYDIHRALFKIRLSGLSESLRRSGDYKEVQIRRLFINAIFARRVPDKIPDYMPLNMQNVRTNESQVQMLSVIISYNVQ